MKTRYLPILFAMGFAIVTLSGCVYRLDVPQGNRIDPELINQLEIGMSRNQVEFLLGSPAVVDLYRPGRWHYIFYHKAGEDGSVVQRRMTLTFTDDLLSGIEGSLDIDGALNPG